MYILCVNSKNLGFYDFLNKESTKMDENTYIFSSLELACSTVSRYILYFIREKLLLDFYKSNELSPSAKEDFLLYVSSDDILFVLNQIKEQTFLYLSKSEVFHFDGFTTFRLKDVHHNLLKILQKALIEFNECQIYSSDISPLQVLLNDQEVKNMELSIVLNEKGHMILRNNEKVFAIEEEGNEDTIISYIFWYKPNYLRVFDYYHAFPERYITFLKHLFKEKVEFFSEFYFAYQDYQK